MVPTINPATPTYSAVEPVVAPQPTTVEVAPPSESDSARTEDQTGNEPRPGDNTYGPSYDVAMAAKFRVEASEASDEAAEGSEPPASDPTGAEARDAQREQALSGYDSARSAIGMTE